MCVRGWQRHFPTAVALHRAIAASRSRTLTRAAKEKPEIDFPPAELCFVLVTCTASGAVGAVFGAALAAGWPLLWPDLQFIVGSGASVGFCGAPFFAMAAKASRRAVTVLLIGHALVSAGSGILIWYFLAAAAAC